ncbi:MAG: DNA oxidative demethylase AlkB [Pseudomonadota bacterium]|nr:DNA oxidative demethylase AlkB [Pseudomonadota bacterium]
MQTDDLFGGPSPGERERMGPCALVLRGWALPHVDAVLPAIAQVQAQAPFRHMTTPGGFTMSVALSNCGCWGWVSDRRGYRYSRVDPVSGQPWPAMPAALYHLAREAAQAAGYPGFAPDACLINRYAPGARMSLHQDKDERDLSAPIVSVSLGMGATFLFGGHARTDKAARLALHHGDVAVWGGEDRLRYHGVMPLEGPPHPLLGSQRINLTFRQAG